MAAQPGNKGFQQGNIAALGGRGPARPDVCTQALLSQLHEIDRTTSKEKIHLLVEQLLKLALGYEKKVKGKDAGGKAKTTTVEVPPDIMAIREVIDRVQGKAPQSIDLDANLSGVVVVEGGLPPAK